MKRQKYKKIISIIIVVILGFFCLVSVINVWRLRAEVVTLTENNESARHQLEESAQLLAEAENMLAENTKELSQEIGDQTIEKQSLSEPGMPEHSLAETSGTAEENIPEDTTIIFSSEFEQLIADNPIDKEMVWEDSGASNRIAFAVQYRDAWEREIEKAIADLEILLPEEDFTLIYTAYEGWKQYMENTTSMEQELFYIGSVYSGTITGSNETYPRVMEVAAIRTRNYAIDLLSLVYTLEGTVEFAYVNQKEGNQKEGLEINIANFMSEIFEEKDDSKDVKITYPQMKDGITETSIKINKLIKEAAFKEYDRLYALDGITFEQTFELENQDGNVLSIVFYGLSYVAGAAYPLNICHAVTINIKDAEILTLSDFIDSYDYVKNKIANNEYEVLSGGLKMFESNVILVELSSYFNKNKMTENAEEFYISKSGKVCMIVEVPHTGGDYSVISV